MSWNGFRSLTWEPSRDENTPSDGLEFLRRQAEFGFAVDGVAGSVAETGALCRVECRNAGESMDGYEQFGSGSSEQIDYNVQPSQFAKLRRGGPLNNFECDAYLVAAKFAATGKSYRKVTFSQK